MTPTTIALELKDISHHYGTLRAVDQVSLHVDAGEVICLLGPSGCGKSTILRIAAGLEALQQGETRMAGQAMAVGGNGLDTPPERRNVGLMFQDFALFPHLDVAGNIAFGLGALTPSEKQARIAEVLGQVGMQAYAHAFPHALSGGQQQRVALARALAPRPRVMLLDEPFSGLDARLREQIREDTLHVLKQSKTATLMVTHDPEEAMFMADRIYLMDSGRVVQSGSPEMLYRRPVDPFVARFFTPVNTFAGTVAAGQVATPLGALPAPGHGEGAAVQILVRPENVIVMQPGEPASGPIVTATLDEVRQLGSVRLLLVRLAGEGELVRIRHGGRYLPEIGGQILLHLEPAEALIFAAPAA